MCNGRDRKMKYNIKLWLVSQIDCLAAVLSLQLCQLKPNFCSHFKAVFMYLFLILLSVDVECTHMSLFSEVINFFVSVNFSLNYKLTIVCVMLYIWLSAAQPLVFCFFILKFLHQIPSESIPTLIGFLLGRVLIFSVRFVDVCPVIVVQSSLLIDRPTQTLKIQSRKD